MSINPDKIVDLIKDEVLEELNLDPNTKTSIYEINSHKHSSSMVLDLEGQLRLFVKFGAHFSGGHGWDVKSEFQGYSIADKMNYDENIYFSIKPVIYREEPTIIATVFEDGNIFHPTLKDAVKKFGSRNLDLTLEITSKTAKWLQLFVDEIRHSREKVKVFEIIKFCNERFSEINKWSPNFKNFNISEEKIDSFLNELFSFYEDGMATVVREHGDFGPHNVFVNPQGKVGVIDFGFQIDPNNPLPYEDASTYLIYLEQMQFNPIYSSEKVQQIKERFVFDLLENDSFREKEFLASYLKKSLAHVAWLHNPKRNPGPYFRDFTYKKWSSNRIKWFDKVLNQGITIKNLI